MQTLLKTVFSKAINLADFNFTPKQIDRQWLGKPPATVSAIEEAQARLNISFPEDYKALLSVTNGFSAPIDVEMNFEPVERIDYLKNIDAFIIQVWRENDMADIADAMERSILVGGIDDEQYFLLIPPKDEQGYWGYWKFSSWLPGEERFDDLNHYLTDMIKFIDECLEKK